MRYNQGIIITTVVNGLKKAIAVQAPAVYTGYEDDSDVVTGACASELAQNMYNTIKTTYPSLEKILNRSWQGNVLDGQYQAKSMSNSADVCHHGICIH